MSVTITQAENAFNASAKYHEVELKSVIKETLINEFDNNNFIDELTDHLYDVIYTVNTDIRDHMIEILEHNEIVNSIKLN